MSYQVIERPVGAWDSFVAVDRQWRIRYAHGIGLRALGLSLEEVLGRDLWETFPDYRGTLSEEVARRAMERGEPARTELLGLLTGRWFEVSIYPTGDGLCLHGSDVTERKLAEEALREAGRRKDEFLAILAHELRNPLAPIRSSAEVLRRLGTTDPQVERAIRRIDRQASHMVRLVDDLLDLSRISRGKILLREERVDLSALVRTTIEDHQGLFEDAGIAFAAELPEEPLWVQGDATRLSQILGNLLQNARKFTDQEGSVAVRLEREPETGRVLLRVEDTGIGMAPEMLARLFEPFSQADRSLDRSRGGLGLGLALAKGLAELHGGSVEAVSPGVGQGSCFTVCLPLTGEAGAGPAAEALHESPGSPLHILVIEDHPDAAESLKMLLEITGHQVDVATDGGAGLDAVRRLHPDLVICDIGLPGMDGYAVARTLRESEETRGLYLIALSGYGQEEDRRKAQEAGFDRHLTKPVDFDTLTSLLDRVPRQVR